MNTKIGYNKFDKKELDDFIQKYFEPYYSDDEDTIIGFYFLHKNDVSILERKFRKYFEFFSNVKLFEKEEIFIEKFKNNEFEFFNSEIVQQIIEESKNIDPFWKKDEQSYKEHQKNSILIDCRKISHNIEGLTIRNYFNVEIESAIDLFKDVYTATKDKKIKSIIKNLENQLKIFEN